MACACRQVLSRSTPRRPLAGAVSSACLQRDAPYPVPRSRMLPRRQYPNPSAIEPSGPSSLGASGNCVFAGGWCFWARTSLSHPPLSTPWGDRWPPALLSASPSPATGACSPRRLLEWYNPGTRRSPPSSRLHSPLRAVEHLAVLRRPLRAVSDKERGPMIIRFLAVDGDHHHHPVPGLGRPYPLPDSDFALTPPLGVLLDPTATRCRGAALLINSPPLPPYDVSRATEVNSVRHNGPG